MKTLKRIIKTGLIGVLSIQFSVAQTTMVTRLKDKSAVIKDVSAVDYIRFYETGSVTDYDGNSYKTVKIGNQWWMAENLKVTHYNDGTEIPNISENASWFSTAAGAYCAFLNLSSNKDIYGYLYNWHAVNGDIDGNGTKDKNIAPVGWHVATDEEWMELEIALGISISDVNNTGNRGTNEGSQLVDRAELWTDGVLENDSQFGLSGFEGLPAGYRDQLFDFSSLGSCTGYWTASFADSDKAWYRFIVYIATKISRNNTSKNSGLSIRCVKD